MGYVQHGGGGGAATIAAVAADGGVVRGALSVRNGQRHEDPDGVAADGGATVVRGARVAVVVASGGGSVVRGAACSASVAQQNLAPCTQHTNHQLLASLHGSQDQHCNASASGKLSQTKSCLAPQCRKRACKCT